MFDHVKFGVSDYEASKAFFLKALEPLGLVVVAEGPPSYGVELSQPDGKVSLCLFETREKPARLHLAFTAETRKQVEAFYRAALAAGGKDNGAPGTGKTTLAKELVRRVKACYLRIDTIEQALRDLCALDVEAEGYALAYRVAADNLRIGTSVVADSCNPVAAARRSWEQVALEAGSQIVNIEVVCSDASEHRRRVRDRQASVPGLELPTWEEVESRDYHPWTQDRILVDTSNKSAMSSVDELLAKLPPRPQ